MDLAFNIIYTPGTVQYLQLFAFSLLKWSDCSFRLVANGCAADEKRSLENLCQKSSRLAFLDLPGDAVMRHDQALSYLQTLERSDRFCFMDSDILATGEFMGELGTYLDRYAGVFSGPPIWYNDEEQVLLEKLSFISGWVSKTDRNLCLGNTHFAIYDNKVLLHLIQSTGVSFVPLRWPDILPPWQRQLAAMGFRKRAYDTGKVLNLLMLAQGSSLACVESAFLQHIGGVSLHITHKKRAWHERVSIRLNLLKRRARSTIRRRVAEDAVPAEARATMWRVRNRQARTVPHFVQVLHALFQDRPLPAAPRLDDPETEARIESMTKEIATLYEEFRGQLV